MDGANGEALPSVAVVVVGFIVAADSVSTSLSSLVFLILRYFARAASCDMTTWDAEIPTMSKTYRTIVACCRIIFSKKVSIVYFL